MGITESSHSRGIGTQQRATHHFNNVREKMAKSKQGEAVALDSPAGFMSDAQLSIELYTKSLYDLIDRSHPHIHRGFFEKDETKGVLNELERELGREYAQMAFRAFAIADIWGGAHPTARYTFDGFNPDRAFQSKDVELIDEHMIEVRKCVEEIFAETANQLEV